MVVRKLKGAGKRFGSSNFKWWLNDNYRKLWVSKKVKVSKEVFRVKSLSKEFQTSCLSPAWKAGGEQAEVQVHGVKENCAHLMWQPFFLGWKLIKCLPQTLSSSRRRQECLGRQLLAWQTKVLPVSFPRPLQAPWNIGLEFHGRHQFRLFLLSCKIVLDYFTMPHSSFAMTK